MGSVVLVEVDESAVGGVSFADPVQPAALTVTF